MECFRQKGIFLRIRKLDQDLRHRCISHGSFCSLASLLSPSYVNINRSARYHTMIPLYRNESTMICIEISHILPISITYRFLITSLTFPSFSMIALTILSKSQFIHCNLCCAQAQSNELREYAVILRFLISCVSIISRNH